MKSTSERETTSAEDSSPPSEPRKSGRWRFSLATLFLLMVAVAVVLAWFRSQEVHYRREAEARAKVRELGGWCNEKPVTFGRLGRILSQEDWYRTDAVDFSPKREGPGSGPVNLVDDDNVAVLYSFPDLTSLRLPYSQVTGRGLAGLGKLTHLEYLVLKCNDLADSDFSFLKPLHKLRTLDLDNTGIDDADLVQLTGLHELVWVHLSGNPIDGSGLVHLGKLERLREVELASTQIGDESLPKLAALHRCWGIRLDSTQVTGRGFAKLGEMKSLTHLRLRDTPVDDQGLAEIASQTNLQSLDLSATLITDAGLPALDRLFALKYLSVDLTKVTQAGVDQFQRVHPNCRVELSLSLPPH
jgi:hypothetical protein